MVAIDVATILKTTNGAVFRQNTESLIFSQRRKTMAKTFNLDFNGYWREKNKYGVPDKSGLYCVYTCTYNELDKTVSTLKLLYIGQSEHVMTRLANHDKLDIWNANLQNGETLCYSYTSVSLADLDRCEAALIYKHKPKINTEYVNNFPFPETIIQLKGKTKGLNSSFTVG
jgi:hypothetical protein